MNPEILSAKLATQDMLLVEPRRWFAQLRGTKAAVLDVSEFAPRVDIEDGIAVIDVKGTIAAGLPDWAEAFDYARPERIQAQLEFAAINKDVRGILLSFDSPGGTVQGTPELASLIAEVAAYKGVYSFTSGMCCSAAYWLAAPSRAILSTPSAELGSIGVYVAHEDLSAMAKAMGIVVSVFKSGKFKGAGVPGTSLSDDQAANIQSRVDSLAAVFKSFVTQHRPGMDEETMQGQSFMGYQAAGVKLTDGTVRDLAEAKKLVALDISNSKA